jgi:hypothetical protein
VKSAELHSVPPLERGGEGEPTGHFYTPDFTRDGSVSNIHRGERGGAGERGGNLVVLL